jgi:tetratricopeptide (TPR) repeat protein
MTPDCLKDRGKCGNLFCDRLVYGFAKNVMNIVLFVVVPILALAALVSLWQLVGRGPRLRRAYTRAQKLLEAGQWREASALVEPLRTAPGQAPEWQQRWQRAAGESQQIATDQAIKDKRYEEALRHALVAGSLLKLAETDQRTRVVEAMLAEARRLFAVNPNEVEGVQQLLTRVLAVQPTCPEATFWQALCLIRQGQLEPAQSALMTAFEQSGKQFLDPALYLGALLHQMGKPQEGIRFLAEANRVDASCPFITWQMGLSMVAAGNDPGLAVRALQRAVGPRGLGMWKDNPARAWVEAFPEARSFVRRLANRHPYTCPLFGGDLSILLRQGQLALAQALYRQGNFQEAADLYTRLMQDSPPTLMLLRGLGLSLARLKRYDQAYKHLRTAMEMEGGGDAFTAGYLALCGAMGKPTNPDDRPKNVAWAIRLLARYQQPANGEWANLYSAVFAEARSLKMPIAEADQVQLCQTLAGVHAFDAPAAAAYAHLAATFPNAVSPHFAWLYARAASVHGFKSDHDLDLFALAFRNAAQMTTYYGVQKWPVEDAEYAFLERAAARAPGRFPEALGDDYAPRGEKFLLERSRQEEQAGRKDAALLCMDVLQKLAPSCLAVYDRLSCLHYRKGDKERALTLLSGWQRLEPANHWPVIRAAIIEQERGNAAKRAEAIDRALGLTRGQEKAAVAYLGARLELREGIQVLQNGRVALTGALARSAGLLEECLRHDPGHVQALWCLAAVHAVTGDRTRLAAMAPALNRPEVQDARFHYLGAVSHLAAKDYGLAVQLGRRAAADEGLAAESQFVVAWALLHQRNGPEARLALQRVAATDKAPSAVYAKALLGQLSFARGAYDDAAKWWNALDAKRRAEWKLDDTLRHSVLLSGLQALDQKRYEQAAERFREAGRLGLRDRRLGDLLTAALVKAGQRLLFEAEK